MWLRSGITVAVVQVGGSSSHSTPSLGTSICCGYSPKKRKKKEKVSFDGHLSETRWQDFHTLSLNLSLPSSFTLTSMSDHSTAMEITDCVE